MKPVISRVSKYGKATYGKVLFNSAIRDNENNDCMVRCVATACDVSYDRAHEFCAEVLKRKNKQGTSTRRIIDMDGTTVFGKKIERIGEVVIDRWNTPSGSYEMFCGMKMLGKWGYKSTGWGDTRRKFRRMSVGSFIKDKRFQTGTYMIAVARHIFTIKDGVILGNFDDARKLKVAIEFAFEVK